LPDIEGKNREFVVKVVVIGEVVVVGVVVIVVFIIVMP
jgi:hypothetical protein